MKISIEKALKDNGYVVYAINGVSMLPLLKEGVDKVHLEVSDTYNQFDIVLFKRRKNTYVLHRIIEIKDDKYIIIGDNATHIDYLKKEDILAKLTGIYKENNIVAIKDVDKNNPYLDKKIRDELIKDPTSFFLRRKEEAYYELIKLATLGEYDENKIKRLTAHELRELAEYLYIKKGFHLLGFAIDKKELVIDKKISQMALTSYQSTLKRVTKIDYTVDEIQKAFTKQKIKHIFLKGAEVKKLYKFPYLRTSNDIDIYIDISDLEKARNILLNDFHSEQIHKKVLYDEKFIFKPTDIKIELHFSISYHLPDDLQFMLNNPFKNAIQDKDYEYRYHLDKDIDILFFIVHTARHIKDAQFWYNSIIDYYYLRNMINPDLLKKARLTKFNECLNAYVDYIYQGNSSNKNYQIFEELMFTNTNKLSKVISTRHVNKFKYILSRIFIPCSELKFKYKVLEKCPLLFPILSIYRWVTLPFKMSKDAKIELEAIKKENDIIINKLKQIGLEEYLVSKDDD